MRSRRTQLLILVLVLLAAAGWLLWQAPGWLGATERETAVLPTLTPTITPLTIAATKIITPTNTPAPSPTPSVTHTPIPPPATSTPQPTVTPTATATPWPSPTAAVDRTCPDPAPLKPPYAHYYLSGEAWPTPAADAAPHFWLSKPLPGGGRYLVNNWFPYGYDANGRYLIHTGVDSADPLGTPVLAAGDGTVIVAGDDAEARYGWRCDWYGHLVVIEHDRQWRDQPVFTLYGHVLNINVEPGDRVTRGDQVAEVGFGGAAQAPHLHFEVRVGSNEFGQTRNPMLWVYPGDTRGVIAGRLVDPEERPWQGVALHLLNDEGDIAAATWSYLDDPQHLINPDEGFAENFVFADVRPGAYVLYTKLQEVEYRQPVTVRVGELTTLTLTTEPFKTPTPAPAVTPTTDEQASPISP